MSLRCDPKLENEIIDYVDEANIIAADAQGGDINVRFEPLKLPILDGYGHKTRTSNFEEFPCLREHVQFPLPLCRTPAPIAEAYDTLIAADFFTIPFREMELLISGGIRILGGKLISFRLLLTGLWETTTKFDAIESEDQN